MKNPAIRRSAIVALLAVLGLGSPASLRPASADDLKDGRVALAAGQLDQALASFERAASQGLAEGRAGVGQVWLKRRQYAKALEAFNLKISKVGGLTHAKLMRDLAMALGLRVTIEDTWGGDLVTAAVSHLAASTPPETLFTVSFMNDWVNEHVAGHEPRSQAGFGSAPSRPGLGIDVDVEALGAPLFSVSA